MHQPTLSLFMFRKMLCFSTTRCFHHQSTKYQLQMSPIGGLLCVCFELLHKKDILLRGLKITKIGIHFAAQAWHECKTK